jgi:hypothetical protein
MAARSCRFFHLKSSRRVYPDSESKDFGLGARKYARGIIFSQGRRRNRIAGRGSSPCRPSPLLGIPIVRKNRPFWNWASTIDTFLHCRIILLFWAPKNLEPTQLERIHAAGWKRRAAVPAGGIFFRNSMPMIQSIMTFREKKQPLQARLRRHRGDMP